MAPLPVLGSARLVEVDSISSETRTWAYCWRWRVQQGFRKLYKQQKDNQSQL